MDVVDTTPINVKATLKDVRRLKVTRNTTLQNVKEILRGRFHYLSSNASKFDLEVTWNDTDDKSQTPVTVSSEEEWKEVLSDIADQQLLDLNVKVVGLQDSDHQPSTSAGTTLNSSQTNYVKSHDTSQPSSIEDRLGHMSMSCNYSNDGSPVAQPSDEFCDQENGDEESIVKSVGVDHQDSPPSSGQQTPTSGSPPGGMIGESITFSFAGENPHEAHVPTEQYGIWPVASDSDTLRNIKVKVPEANRRNPSKTYELSGKKKGRLILINNKKYSTLPELRGTDFDATSLSILFKKLGFDVKTFVNLDVKSIKEHLIKEKTELEKNSWKYGSYVVVMMAHCEGENVYGREGETVNVKFLVDWFSEIIPGKPKLFFLEGLRHNLHNPRSFKHCPIENVKIMENPSPMLRVGTVQTDACPTAVCTDVYFYVGGTLGEGLPSIKGSLMLQAFVKAMSENVHTLSFKEIMNKTEELMENAVSKTENFRMPRVHTDSLKKHLYFM